MLVKDIWGRDLVPLMVRIEKMFPFLNHLLTFTLDPWSGVDFCVPESSIHGLVPSFCSRSGRLTTQTQLFIKHFLDPNPTGCMDHVESNCIRPHEQYAIVQRVFEAAYATLAAVAIMAIFTLQAHGLQLTWTIIYGLFVLLAAVLVVIRMLL